MINVTMTLELSQQRSDRALTCVFCRIIFIKYQCFLVFYKKICLKQDEVCNKRDRTITCVLCRDLHLTLKFSGLYKKICLKESFGGKIFQTKLLSRLSHKVCCLLSFPVLLREFTYRQRIKIAVVLSAGINISVIYKKRVLFILHLVI